MIIKQLHSSLIKLVQQSSYRKLWTLYVVFIPLYFYDWKISKFPLSHWQLLIPFSTPRPYLGRWTWLEVAGWVETLNVPLIWKYHTNCFKPSLHKSSFCWMKYSIQQIILDLLVQLMRLLKMAEISLARFWHFSLKFWGWNKMNQEWNQKIIGLPLPLGFLLASSHHFLWNRKWHHRWSRQWRSVTSHQNVYEMTF